ncbi:MAG: regulatory protein RecX [Chromatiales bacterium]|jgi:regulatory protein|nr:regulatory protein RecX [Chromatiales bacterium]
MSTNTEFKAVYERAVALLARREHSRVELRRKLSRKAYPGDAIEQVLDALVAERLQSDDRFAYEYCRSRAGRGYGPRYISAKLRERGVAAQTASLALESADFVWVQGCDEARRKRYGDEGPQSRKEWERQARFLSQRGFTEAQIRTVLHF